MYQTLLYLHLATVLPCVFIGLYLFIAKKGSPYHKLIGKIYMALMLFTAFVTLFMPAYVGPNILNHFGFIHLFSFLTLYTVPTAIAAAKRGDIKAHKRKMIGMYIGALIIAGGLAFFPGRFMYNLFFG